MSFSPTWRADGGSGVVGARGFGGWWREVRRRREEEEEGGEGFRDWRVAREFGGESRRGLQVEWRGKMKGRERMKW